MSISPVDVVRSANAAFNDRDLETMALFYDPDVVWEDLQPAPDQPPVVKGLDDVLASFRGYLDSFEHFTAHLLDTENVGEEAAIGTVEWRGTGAGSQLLIDLRTVDVVWVNGGRITHYISGFGTKEDGLHAISENRRPGG